jgi:hypothetical protein
LPMYVMRSDIQHRQTNHKTLHCISGTPKKRRPDCWFFGPLGIDIIPTAECGLVQYRRIFHFTFTADQWRKKHFATGLQAQNILLSAKCDVLYTSGKQIIQ